MVIIIIIIIVLIDGLSDVRKPDETEFRFHMFGSRVVGFRGSAMRRLVGCLGSVLVPEPLTRFM